MTETTDARQDLAKVEAALDALLRTIAEHEAKEAKRVPGPITATPFVWYGDEPILSRAEIETKSLLRDPIGSACRHAIRKIGLHVFQTLGSTDGMRDTLERVADMDKAYWGNRATIMDHAWDGIGSDKDRWWV